MELNPAFWDKEANDWAASAMYVNASSGVEQVNQGYINKEIADKLNIGLTTVITHRKNIMDKLGMKSVSALTIYAVMHGYVDIRISINIRSTVLTTK